MWLLVSRRSFGYIQQVGLDLPAQLAEVLLVFGALLRGPLLLAAALVFLPRRQGWMPPQRTGPSGSTCHWRRRPRSPWPPCLLRCERTEVEQGSGLGRCRG